MHAVRASLLNRMRFAVLVLLAAAAGIYALPTSLPLLLALAAGFVLALARLRQVGLALVAALGALPGLLWLDLSAYPLCLGFAILLAAALRDAGLKKPLLV